MYTRCSYDLLISFYDYLLSDDRGNLYIKNGLISSDIGIYNISGKLLASFRPPVGINMVDHELTLTPAGGGVSTRNDGDVVKVITFCPKHNVNGIDPKHMQMFDVEGRLIYQLTHKRWLRYLW